LDQPQALLPGNFDKLREAIKDLDHDPWMNFYREVMRWCDIQQRAAEWRRLYIKGGKKTTERTQKFKMFVDETGIPVDLTDYAVRKWPQEPDEFYCEAFAIWRVDPPALRRHSEGLYQYFQAGKHLTGR
jgi:hypothetical protein